jgi:HlyD family secretion protein
MEKRHVRIEDIRLKIVGSIANWIKRHPVWSGLIGLVAVLLLYGLLRPATPTYAYVSEAADRGEVVRKVTASGKLRALNTIKVGAEVSGQITRVNVDFNSAVKAGQVLAEIDQTRVRARMQQAQAQVALAQANLMQAEAAAVRARTDMGVQERDYARKKTLTEQGFFSKSALDNATSVVASAKAALASANAQIASARAQIAQSNAELSSAQLDLDRTVIIAPSSGVIINKLVEPGTTVAASFQTPNLFEIAADITRMQVEASVDEADIGQIREGQDVRFTVDSYPDETFKAKVRQIRKSATETQNVVSYLVILDVDNPDGKLLPGMTANVEIVTGQKANVLRAPAAALRFRPRAEDLPDGGGKKAPSAPTVYVVGADPYRPVRRTVTVGLVGEDHVEILKGLKPGEKLIVRSRTLEGDGAESEDKDGDGQPDEGAGGGHPAP